MAAGAGTRGEEASPVPGPAQMGFDRFNKNMPNSIFITQKDNIDYPGNVFPVPGWPNNWIAARFAQRIGPVTLSVAGTRLNLLDNKLETFWSPQVACESPSPVDSRAPL